MSDLAVGDEVICIDDAKTDGWNILHFPNWVQKDNKYIIREFLDNDDIVVGVLLEELRNPEVFINLIDRYQECAFATWRFRKIRSSYAIKEEKDSESIVRELGLEVLGDDHL